MQREGILNKDMGETAPAGWSEQVCVVGTGVEDELK